MFSTKLKTQSISMTRRHLCTIFNGVKLAQTIKEEVKQELQTIQQSNSSFKPKLVAIAVGNNPASKIYLKKKSEAAQYCGLDFDKISLNSNTSELDLLGLVDSLNNEQGVDGVIVQLPLPDHINEHTVCNAVSPGKDVDGFTQTNLGKLMQRADNDSLIPCTALAVKRIVKEIHSRTLGMNAVVIGRSHNVGLPIQIILGADSVKGGCDMTTTLCHRHTPVSQLHSALASAHLVVSAAGVPGLLHRNILRPGAVIIDVGLNRVGGKLVGDAADNVREVASVVTPVPGGVGPCTVACLMHNTLLAAKSL